MSLTIQARRVRQIARRAITVLCVAGSAGWVGPAWAANEPPAQERPFLYDPHDHRDPFVSLMCGGRLCSEAGGETVSTAKPTLSLILWDPYGKSFALINGTEVTVGDLVGEYTVIDIQQDAVVLKGRGEPVVLQIDEEVAAHVTPGATTGGARQ